MDSLVKDLLEHVIERLDKIEKHQKVQRDTQPQLSHVIERLDTIQNCVEIQNQKQSVLEEKLSAVTSTLEQEKVFMRDQLKDAQHEILVRLSDLHERSGERKTTSSTAEHDEIPRLSDAAQTQINIPPPSNPLTVSTELSAQLKDALHAGFDNVFESLEDSVKTLTRAELVWLGGRLEQLFSEFTATINETVLGIRIELRDLAEESNQMREQFKKGVGQSLSSVAKAEVEADVEDCPESTERMLQNVTVPTSPDFNTAMAVIVKEFRDSNEQLRERSVEETTLKMERYLNIVHENIKQEHTKANTEMIGDLGKRIESKAKESATELKYVRDMLNDVASGNETSKKEILTACSQQYQSLQKHIDFKMQETATETTEIKASIEDVKSKVVDTAEIVTSLSNMVDDLKGTTAEMKETMLEAQVDHTDTIETKLEKSVKEVKDNLYKVKREIFAVTEKEAQITRDRIQVDEDSMDSNEHYTFDLYVDNFKNLVRSRSEVHSPPWHIKEFESSIAGKAEFLSNGMMKVKLIYGRNPRVVGLQPRSGVKLKAKATITDTKGDLPDLEVGEDTGTKDETKIKANLDFGRTLGEMSCDELVEMGYGEAEGYANGALLIRFEIDVL